MFIQRTTSCAQAYHNGISHLVEPDHPGGQGGPLIDFVRPSTRGVAPAVE
jgi:hypothetical protein